MGLDIDRILDRAYKCELLEQNIILALCDRVNDVLEQETNVKSVPAPVTVVGDIHGQFYDIIEMFRISGRKRIIVFRMFFSASSDQLSVSG